MKRIPLTLTNRYPLTVMLALILALSGLLWQPFIARATNITVVANAMTINPNDNVCSLPEAIIAANGNTASGLGAGECPAGNVGMDVITLPAGTYNLTGTLSINAGSVTINGAAATSTIINGAATYQVFNITTGGTVMFTNLTIQNGKVSGGADGGGIFNNSSFLTLQSINLTSNQVITGDGGGLYNANGTVTVISSTIASNSAMTTGGYDGGGLYNANGTLTISATTLTSNSASGDGGAIYNSNGTVTLNNSTVDKNSAQDHGGGIAMNGTALALNSSTIILNTANSDLITTVGDGGGVYVAGGTANVRNSLIIGNKDLGGASNHPDFSGAAISNQGNLLTDLTGASGFVASEVTAVALSAIVNTTSSGTPAVYALTASSPAIDHGASDSTSCPTPDERGQARPQGPNCDSGAYELAQAFNLSITKGVTAVPAAPVVPGQTITYNITFTNNAVSYTATNVLITDTLPAAIDPTTVIISNSGATITSTLGPPSATLAWQVQNLGSGQNGTLTVSGMVTGNVAATLTNTITITGANGETAVANNVATSTIAMTLPLVTFSSATYNTTEGAGVFSVTVNLNRTPQTPTTVNYATSDGSAVQPSDYTTSMGTLTFNPGQTSLTFAVQIIEDSIAELPETVTVTLSSPTYAMLGAITTAMLTITDNDPAKILITQSVASSDVMEGGITDDYDMVLNGAPTGNVVITISPDAQTLVAPTMLTFTNSNWNIVQTVIITAVDDAAIEGNHTSTIAHSAVSTDSRFNSGSAIFVVDGITQTTITANVTDNEDGFTVARSHVSVTEGNVGTTPITFTVTQIGSTSTVSYTFNIGSNATAGLDYQNLAIDGVAAPTQGTISFAPGISTALVTMDIIGDLIDEADEIIQMIISTYDFTSTTIIDDDTAGVTALQITGNTYENGNLTNFPIVLTSQPTSTVTLNLVSSDTTEGTLAPASLTFDATNWNIPQVVTMTGVDDVLFDGNITYTLNVATIMSLDTQYASLTPGAIATITNIDDELISNLPPTITLTTTTITTTENTATPAIPFTLADDNTPVGSLVITLTSTNPTLLPNGNIALGGTGANRTLTLTPAMSQSGTAVVQMQVADTDGGVSSAFVILTVTPNNQPPIANNNTINTPEDTAVTIAILGNDTDSDGTLNPITVLITSYPTHGTLTINADGSVNYTPTPQFSGSDSFTYRVSDDEGLASNTAIVFIAVTPFNDPPMLTTPIPDQTARLNQLFNYTFPLTTFTDVDNTVLSYTARLVDGSPLPSWLSFNPTSRTFSGTATMSGTLNIEVTASDGMNSVSDTFMLTVPANRAPVLLTSLPDATVSAGQSLSFNVSPNFSDPDGDPISYTARRLDGFPLPSWLNFNSVTGLFTGNPPTNSPTVAYVIQITASDGSLSAADNFVLTVQGITPTVTPTITPTVTPTVTITATVTVTPGLGGISGLVRGTDNTLLNNINILIDRLNGSTWELFVAQTTTNVAGEYQLRNLAAGTYRLHFVDVTGKYASLYYLNTSNPDAATPVTVVANQITPSINMVLPLATSPTIAVSGNVATDGASDSNLKVVAWQGSSLSVDLQVSCDSGAVPSNAQLVVGSLSPFTMTAMQTGHFSTTLTVPTQLATEGQHDLTVTWQCDGFTHSKAFGQLNLYLFDPSGQITNAVTGQPISGATVTLYRVPNALPDSSATSRDGACRVGGAWQSEPAATVNASQRVDPNTLVNGSPIISPTMNPEITGNEGRFAWDVIQGCWYIYAEANGYVSKSSPLVGVPPHVTNLNIALSPIGTPLPPRKVYLPMVKK